MDEQGSLPGAMALKLDRGTDGAAHIAALARTRWELVQRITASTQFKKSPRLRDLFLYICRRAIDEAATEIREQEVGANVFGRSPDYDTSQDPIVRVQASQLRKKLQQYFESEGSSEPLILEIPKGGYLPVFRTRPKLPEASVPFGPDGLAGRSGIRRWLVPLLVSAVAVLAALSAWLAARGIELRASGGWDSSPALQLLWSRFFRANQPPSVVVADSCLSLLQDALRRPVGLNEYLRRDYRQWLEEVPSDSKLKDFLKMMMARQYTSLADLGLVKRILAVGGGRQQAVSVVFARNYQVRGASTDNLILLGSRRSNPWVELFEKPLNFRFDYDEESRKAIVRNHSPRAGESATYLIPGTGAEIQEGYAVVAFLPNLGRNGSVLIVAGTDMEATEAAGQFVTTEAQLGRFFQALSPRRRGELPYFEVLLKTKRVGGAPSECDVLAWRLPQV